MAAGAVGVYDICVVGAGMIGSAAARHISKHSGVRVCLVGPSEPQERSLKESRDIFASHYDAGRITRVLDSDPTWCTINARAQDSYHDLSQQTGIDFFEEVGCLFLDFTSPRGDLVNKVLQQAQENEIPHKKINTDDIGSILPYLSLPAGYEGALEEKRSGYVNPRMLVMAEQIAARQQGCDVIQTCVQKISDTFHVDGTPLKLVTLENGDVIRSKKVLLATGAFTSFRDLLPAGIEPNVTLRAPTIAKICISENDAQTLASMPSSIVRMHHSDGHTYFYFTPPIKYPDGKYYLKIGHGSDSGRILTTSQEVKSWFCCNGDPKAVACMSQFLLGILPGVKALSIEGDTCITANTPTMRPYIDLLSPSLGVAIAGCGRAAKNCDELGRMAANMMIRGSWDYDLPAGLFRFQRKTNQVGAKL